MQEPAHGTQQLAYIHYTSSVVRCCRWQDSAAGAVYTAGLMEGRWHSQSCCNTLLDHVPSKHRWSCVAVDTAATARDSLEASHCQHCAHAGAVLIAWLGHTPSHPLAPAGFPQLTSSHRARRSSTGSDAASRGTLTGRPRKADSLSTQRCCSGVSLATAWLLRGAPPAAVGAASLLPAGCEVRMALMPLLPCSVHMSRRYRVSRQRSHQTATSATPPDHKDAFRWPRCLCN
jgi:hypothetical protein